LCDLNAYTYKLVLEKFKLPKHYFHPVKLQPKKISTTTNFYLLHLDLDTLTKDLDYESQNFFYKMITYNERAHGLVNEKITSYEDYDNARINYQNKIGTYTNIYPNEYVLKTDYDIYSYSVHSHFVVNQFVKDELEKHFPNQMVFTSAQSLNIRMNQKVYEDKSDRKIEIKNIGKVQFRKSSEELFFNEKKERLEKENKLLNLEQTQNDVFSEIELKLNVLFPKTLKSKILKNKLEIDDYKLLPIPEFYTQNEFHDRYPETYKSVVIAENEFGDSLGLILEKENDYLLSKKLYLFNHENGEIETVK